jgi:hypothetical protein
MALKIDPHAVDQIVKFVARERAAEDADVPPNVHYWG